MITGNGTIQIGSQGEDRLGARDFGNTIQKLIKLES